MLARAGVDETHNSTVGQTSADCQFAKVFVERNEYTLFPVRLRQDVFIAWVLRQITCPKYVVAGCLKLSSRPAPNTGIEQQLHAADSIFRGSIRSWPTMRRA